MGDYGLKGKYSYKSNTMNAFSNFDSIAGVRVLSIDGFNERGEAVNVYTAQWIDSEVEDYVCTKQREVSGVMQDVIIRKNTDLNLTLIVSRRYASNESQVDEQSTYESLISTICETGAIYLKSEYTGMQARVVCLKSFKPTAEKLHRGRNSYILATIPFHVLEPPTSANT